MYIHVYPDALRADPPPRFFLRGCAYRWGIWGGRSPPQGHSPNDTVICLSNLQYSMVFRGPLGVLWESWASCGDPEGSGASWEGLGSQGGSGRVQGGGVKNVFVFLLDVNLSMV